MALIVVISVLTLATVLLLALLSTTQTELKSTVAFADGSAARINADSAVNIVMGQIRKATEQRSDVTGREIWTSQPGMVRQYRETGVLLGGHKLYSDRTMTATSESAIAADLPAWNWDTLPDNYVDLNEPVARLDPANPAAGPRWFFPIIDPRAYSTDPQNSVEGFSYTTSTNGVAGGTSLAGVVLPSGGGASDGQRVPMPVEWLYMLKDGTLGYLSNNGKFVGAGGVKASIDNLLCRGWHSGRMTSPAKSTSTPLAREPRGILPVCFTTATVTGLASSPWHTNTSAIPVTPPRCV